MDWTYIYICTHTYTHPHRCIHAYTHTHQYMYTYMHIYKCICMCILYVYVYLFACLLACLFDCLFVGFSQTYTYDYLDVPFYQSHGVPDTQVKYKPSGGLHVHTCLASYLVFALLVHASWLSSHSTSSFSCVLFVSPPCLSTL